MAPRLLSDRMLDLFRMERTPGLHVSTAIYAVMESLHPERFGSDPPDQVRMNLGNAFEYALVDALTQAYPDRYLRPGELSLDDITGTPDLWDTVDWATVEIKLTWASSRRAVDIEDPWFWRYWAQLKSYAHMAGQSTGRLIICFVNGDYKDSGPQALMWEDKWSVQELEENWEMIKAYARSEHKKQRSSADDGEAFGSTESSAETPSTTSVKSRTAKQERSSLILPSTSGLGETRGGSVRTRGQQKSLRAKRR